MEYFWILPLCFGVVAFLCVVALYVEFRTKLNHIQADHKELIERVQKLEAANPKRINYQSLEEIENALAELAVLEMDNDLRAERIASIKAHLAKAHTPTNKKEKQS